MMWWWDGPWNIGNWIGVGFMSIFWIAVIVGIVFLIRHAASRPGAYGPPVPPPAGQALPPGTPVDATVDAKTDAKTDAKQEALRILDERYARGEIDREEFLQRKTDLTS